MEYPMSESEKETIKKVAQALRGALVTALERIKEGLRKCIPLIARAAEREKKLRAKAKYEKRVRNRQKLYEKRKRRGFIK